MHKCNEDTLWRNILASRRCRSRHPLKTSSCPMRLRPDNAYIAIAGHNPFNLVILPIDYNKRNFTTWWLLTIANTAMFVIKSIVILIVVRFMDLSIVVSFRWLHTGNCLCCGSPFNVSFKRSRYGSIKNVHLINWTTVLNEVYIPQTTFHCPMWYTKYDKMRLPPALLAY